jgi:hypothetical protein
MQLTEFENTKAVLADLQEYAKRPTVEQLYRNTIQTLRGACVDAYEFIHPNDVDHILSKLYADLPKYRGKRSPQPFTAWAVRYVRNQSLLLQRFYQMRSDYQDVVRKGIWSIGNNARDLGFTDREVPALESRVWEWLRYDESSPLYTKGVAKPGREHYAKGSAGPVTRLYNFARYQALGWRTECLRHRARFTPLDTFLQTEDDKQIATVPQSLARPNLEKIERRPAEFEADFDEALAATIAPDKPELVTNAGNAPVSPVRLCASCRAALGRWNQSAKSICFSCWNAAFPDAA